MACLQFIPPAYVPRLVRGIQEIVRLRVWEHKNSLIPGFTAKYNVHMLVYYEVHAICVEAARREKRLKNWRRQWKLNLTETINPNRMIYMKIFAVDWDHLDAADKPRHVGRVDKL